MALANYSDLVNAVADWAHRSDIASGTIDSFISLAEAEFNNRLRCVEQETVATLTCVSEFTSLPADFLEMRSVRGSDGSELYPVAYASPEYNAIQSSLDVPTVPSVYSIVGSDLQLLPAPSSTTLTIGYWAKVPALTSSNTTNWLMTAHPNMYLYECLRQLSVYTKDDAAVVRYAQLMAGYYDAMKRSDMGKRFSGRLRVRVA